MAVTLHSHTIHVETSTSGPGGGVTGTRVHLVQVGQEEHDTVCKPLDQPWHDLRSPGDGRRQGTNGPEGDPGPHRRMDAGPHQTPPPKSDAYAFLQKPKSTIGLCSFLRFPSIVCGPSKKWSLLWPIGCRNLREGSINP